MHIYTLLCHLFELLAKRERHFSNDEALENGADRLENHYIQHALNILLNHVTNHIWIGHHLCHLIELYLLFKVTAIFLAEIRLSLLHAIFGKEVGMFSDTARAEHGATML
jgi:hypothetical protein